MAKFKKMLGFLLILTFAVSTFGGFTVLANSGITVEINGQRVNFGDQPPVIVDGRTLVPVRGVFEMLGYTVGWEQSTSTATLSNGANTVLITVGSPVFITNGQAHNLDVPAQVINGRTMIPLRAVVESVGLGLEWHDATQTISISGTTNIPTTQPTVTDMVFYNQFPTVPDFAWVVRDYVTIPPQNIIDTDHEWWSYAESGFEYSLTDYFHRMNPNLPVIDLSGDMFSFDGQRLRPFLADVERLYDIYISALISQGFTMVAEYDMTRGITDGWDFNLQYAGWFSNAVIREFQRGGVTVGVVFLYDAGGMQQAKNLQNVNTSIVVFIRDNADTSIYGNWSGLHRNEHGEFVRTLMQFSRGGERDGFFEIFVSNPDGTYEQGRGEFWLRDDYPHDGSLFLFFDYGYDGTRSVTEIYVPVISANRLLLAPNIEFRRTGSADAEEAAWIATLSNAMTGVYIPQWQPPHVTTPPTTQPTQPPVTQPQTPPTTQPQQPPAGNNNNAERDRIQREIDTLRGQIRRIQDWITSERNQLIMDRNFLRTTTNAATRSRLEQSIENSERQIRLWEEQIRDYERRISNLQSQLR